MTVVHRVHRWHPPSIVQTQFGDKLNRCSRRFQVVSWPNLTLFQTKTIGELKPWHRYSPDLFIEYRVPNFSSSQFSAYFASPFHRLINLIVIVGVLGSFLLFHLYSFSILIQCFLLFFSKIANLPFLPYFMYIHLYYCNYECVSFYRLFGLILAKILILPCWCCYWWWFLYTYRCDFLLVNYYCMLFLLYFTFWILLNFFFFFFFFFTNNPYIIRRTLHDAGEWTNDQSYIIMSTASARVSKYSSLHWTTSDDLTSFNSGCYRNSSCMCRPLYTGHHFRSPFVLCI